MRRQRDGAAIGGSGVVGAALELEGEGEVVMREGEIRMQREGALEAPHRFRHVLRHEMDEAEMIMRHGIAGVRLEGARIDRAGAGEGAIRAQQLDEGAGGADGARLPGQCRVEQLRAERRLAGPRRQHGEEVGRIEMLRPQRQDLLA